MSGPELVIEAAGARTSVGETLAETSNSIALRIQRIVRGPFIGIDGARQAIAPVVAFGDELRGMARSCLVAAPAVRDCLARLDPRAVSRAEPALLLLSVDSPPDAEDDPMVAAFVESVRASAVVRDEVAGHLRDALVTAGFTDLEVELRCEGAAQSVGALDRARVALEGRFRRVIWGGITSACESPWMEWRMVRAAVRPPRLRAPLVVGEAAAFLCLRRDTDGQEECPRIGGWSSAEDENVAVGMATTGGAITHSLEAAVLANDEFTAIGRGQPAPLVAVDLPDCRALSSEWDMAEARVFGARGVVPEPWRPWLSLGEIEAATLPAYIALLAHELGPGQSGVCAVMNDPPRRAAVGLHRRGVSHGRG